VALGTLPLPDRLYGREPRLARLRTAYERVAAGGPSGLTCLAGAPGVGTSALLAEFAGEVRDAGGLVLTGTCEPGIPYSALTGALSGLGTRTGRPVAVGSGADVLVELVPALGALLGPQPPVPDLPALQAQARTRLAVRRLLAEVADAVRPLVLVLDDLHHADEASLDLLGALLGEEPVPYLLILAACRPHTPAVRDLGGAVTTMPLRPLPDAALTDLLADALGASRAGVGQLVRLVAAKTGSTPLSVRHFLYRLVDARAVRAEDDGWRWDLDAVRLVGAGTGPRELIGYRLGALPPEVRDLLATAAPTGTRLDPALLAVVTGTDAGTVTDRLDPAVPAGFLTPDGDGYRWAHDEVRLAALDLTPAEERDALRLRIGRAMLAGGYPAVEVVRQLNGVPELVVDPGERARLAALDLAAGQAAQRVGAVDAARGYFAAGLAALPDDPWPDLAVTLHMRAAEAEHVAGDQGRALHLLDQAMVRTVDVGRVEILTLHANLPRLSGEWDADAEPGLRALRLLGIDLPDSTPGWRSAADSALVTLRHRLSVVRPADLTGRPAMTDRRALAAANLIATLLPAARVRPPDWLALLAARGVTLALDHGGTAASGIPFAFAGLVLADQREHEAAELCMDVALALVDGTPYAAQTKAVVALSLPPWRRSVRFALGLLREAYGDALDRGDERFATANWILYQMHLFATGTHLDAVAGETRAVWEFLARQGGDPFAGMSNRAMDEILESLRGKGSGVAPAETPAEERLAAACRAGTLGRASSVVLTRRSWAAVLLGEYAEALELAETAQSVEPYGRGGFTTADRWFSHALALTGRYDSGSERQRRVWLAKLDELQAALDDWAAAAPDSFGYRALLVSAERARVAGAVDQAVAQYSRAMASAREHGCLPVEAIAAELGGRYAAARGLDAAAVAYWGRARTCYEQWGATRKVEQLDRALAELTRQPADSLAALAALESVRSTNALLDATIEALPMPLVVLDPQRRVQVASAKAVALLGTPVPPGTPLAELGVDGQPTEPVYDAGGRLVGYTLVLTP
jgi:predicted ATPase